MTLEFRPFRIAVPDADLDDLRARLGQTRFPNAIEGIGWDQGTELEYLRELIAYWRDRFDWRAQEARLNSFENVVTDVDGQSVHFVHARSPEPDALPLIISHGWPGSVVEFLDVFGPLADPRAHGGDPADAFHVVAPSLPGYGFSGPTSQRGWNPRRMAEAFARIMADLGYDRYGAQGGDWGSIISQNIAAVDAAHVCGLHVNFITIPRPRDEPPAPLTAEQERNLEAIREWRLTGTGYQEIQGTKPQTLGYALEDSPAGLCAWIVEKFRAWTSDDEDFERAFTKDQLLTNVMVYWVTRTATSSTRLYWEMRRAGRSAIPQEYVGVPTGIANFPREVTKTPREWVERRYNVTHWTELP
ncbi:MAG: epoxide hydrolase 1, partial [Actinobacteria bacterium]